MSLYNTHIPDCQADGRGLRYYCLSSFCIWINRFEAQKTRQRHLTAALTTAKMFLFLFIVLLFMVAYFIGHRIFVHRKTFTGTAKLYGKTVIVTGELRYVTFLQKFASCKISQRLFFQISTQMFLLKFLRRNENRI